MILCDTNIFIEVYRRNTKVCAVLKNIGHENIVVSDVTLAELYYGAFNKSELQKIRNDMNNIQVLHIHQEISKMAVDLVGQYCLSHKTDIEDALIAATAIYHKLELYTLNVKDFSFIPNIKLYK